MNVPERDSAFLDALSRIGRPQRPIDRFTAETELAKDVPALAALLRIEAIADGRAENDQNEFAKAALIRKIAREAVEKTTGEPFVNPIYPGARS